MKRSTFLGIVAVPIVILATAGLLMSFSKGDLPQTEKLKLNEKNYFLDIGADYIFLINSVIDLDK